MPEKPPIRLKFREQSPQPSSPQPPRAAAPAKVPIPTERAKVTAKPPPIGTEALVVKCGHTIAFDLLAKDPHRDQRRANATARDCVPCRQARVATELAAAAERRARRTLEKSTKKEAFLRSLKPRLPDGSHFAARYDATAVRWTGTITIEGVTFEGHASNLTKLLHKLDDTYRAAIAPTSVPTPGAPGPEAARAEAEQPKVSAPNMP